jgi:hypothetical protein
MSQGNQQAGPTLQGLLQKINAQSVTIANLQAAISKLMQPTGALPSFPNKLISPFTYTVITAPIAPGGNLIQPLQFAADSVFELLRVFILTSADTPSNYFQNYCTVLMTDGSTSRNMANQFVPQAHFGTDAYQFGSDEKYPIQFPANTNMSFSINSLIGAGGPNLTVTISLKGYKIFAIQPGS